MIAPVEKIVLFIDGANLYATTKKLGIEIDYKKLLQEFRSRGNLGRVLINQPRSTLDGACPQC